jgi:hypothetical protein
MKYEVVAMTVHQLIRPNLAIHMKYEVVAMVIPQLI